jgi:hypothetical protein
MATIERKFIETKEAEVILNRSNSTVLRYFALIRDTYNKSKRSRITIQEFCEYFELDRNTLKLS